MHAAQWTRSLLLLTFVLEACGEYGADTCSGGTNMEAPRLASGIEVAADGSSFARVTWDPGTGPGASLPDRYFAAAQVDASTLAAVAASIASVKLTGQRELTIAFRTNPGAAPGEVVVVLVFPDRREFLHCRHPGMADRYLLRTVLQFDADGRLAQSSFAEQGLLGAI